MLVVASSVSVYARAARSATTCMWNSIDSASGWTWTTPTSAPSSLAYSLNAISRGSFASMNSQRSGTRLVSSSSLPFLSLLVAMKINGPDMAAPFVYWCLRSSQHEGEARLAPTGTQHSAEFEGTPRPYGHP